MGRLLLVLLFSLTAVAKTADVYPLPTPEQRLAFQHLTTELRCLVCQNQNLADSNAELAITMRGKIHRMLLQGKSEADIKEFLQQSYGNFILFSPPLTWQTLGLWLLPFMVLASGVLLAGVKLWSWSVRL
jgi:cytochrome c-type biogenesis protein CcmH